MNNAENSSEVLTQLSAHPPKIIGGYKKPGWAVKTLEKISNESVEVEEDGTVTAKAVLLAADQTYYPAFLSLDKDSGRKIIGAYLIAEQDEEYILIPFEIAKDFLQKEESELTPFRYRTLEKIEGDLFQKNWPDFS
ncbi:hypothetical protein HPT25_07410 [Bacillus sp. BRMEA1]|uniref:hypothetical protein n=1 Tax=Neobacillus endophyticus TaxID=2738405 RepID=UPI001566F789|nr:hypothetical protein [Neobacillus endophyticus]NRD77325.1 hypothetical protein [Neobacillus endophyticus]